MLCRPIPVIFCLACAAPAQQFVEVRRSQPDLQVAETKHLFTVDIDGNGLVDLVMQIPTALRYQQNRKAVLRNLGGGRFTGTALGDTFVLGVGDLDGDQDSDLVLCGGIAVNDGRGGFTVRRLPFFGCYDSRRAATGDVDGDQRIDVVIGPNLHRNLGQLNFASPVTIAQAPAAGVGIPVLVDVDKDQDLDLVYATLKGPTQLFLNDGKGNFADATATNMPKDNATTNDIVVLDFDRDGDVDLLLGDPRPTLYLNDGKGKFTDGSSVFSQVPTGKTLSIDAGDIDGDLDIDVILGEEAGGRLLENTGTGFRVAINQWSAGGAHVHGVALVDLDRDGDLDIATSRGDSPSPLLASFGVENDVAFNDGKGRFARSRGEPVPIPLRKGHAALGDLNGDGDPDLLATEGAGALLLGDGRGTFGSPVALNLTVTGVPILGDLDGDRDLDAVVLGARSFHVLDNPGNGVLKFTRSYALQGFGSNFVATRGRLADFNGDGSLDLIIATTGPLFGWYRLRTPDLLWMGTGRGMFRDASGLISEVTTSATDIVVDDLDGDGDPDAVIDGGYIYINESNQATFSPRRYRVRHSGEASLALGDMDGDGDLDLVSGNTCTGIGCSPNRDGPPNTIHWNDGRGNFLSNDYLTLLSTDYTHTKSTALADVDEDGDLDIVFGNVSGNSPNNMWIRNEGQRKFTGLFLPEDFDDTVGSFLVDVDRDGDLDFVAINVGRYLLTVEPRSNVLVNARRQVRAPYASRIGQPYLIEVYGVPGGGMLMLGAQPARVPTPFGILGLDLRVAMIAAQFAPGTSTRSVSFQIPRRISLVGSSFWMQALVVRGTQNRLTNTLQERVIGN